MGGSERTWCIWHISCQSTDKELLPAFVLLCYCPLYIITFLKLFLGKLMTFLQIKNGTQIEKKLHFKNYIKLGYKTKVWNMRQHKILKNLFVLVMRFYLIYKAFSFE